MINNILVISNNSEMIKSLTVGAGAFGAKITLIYGGDKSSAVNADKALYIGELDNISYVQVIPAIAKLAADLKPELVLTDNSRDGRLVSAAVAVSLGYAVVSDVMNVKAENGCAVTERMVYGGGAIKTDKLESGVICCGAGVFDAENAPVKPVESEDAGIQPAEGTSLNEVRAKEITNTNLAAAKKIVVVGRGIGDADGVAAAKSLADKMGAELGCTRPVAEEAKLLPKERYIGVSGVIVKPEVLLSLGASGQVQHTVGTSQSGVIIAVDKDKRAPIFEACDYGVIADCSTVISALMERLK